MNKTVLFLIAALMLAASVLPAWSAPSPVYTVAIDAEFAPYEYRDSVGRPVGFTVALLQEIGRRAGVTFRFEVVTWPEAVAGLENGRFDLVNMIQTPERKEKYELSAPHSRVAQGLFARISEHDDLFGPDSLAGHSVVLQQSDISLEEIQKRSDFSKISLQFVQSKEAGFLLLEAGKTDFFLAAEQPGIWTMQRFGLKNVRIVATNIFPQNYGFAARKGRVELIALLNIHLNTLVTSKKYSDLVQENMLPVPVPMSWFTRHQTELMVLIAVLIVGIVGSLAWILLLRRAVKIRTVQCQLGEERFRSLFQHLPISVWEEDFSGVKLEFDRLRAEGITDFRAHFQKHPELLNLCASQIKILAINDESAVIFGVDTAAELFTKPLDLHFSDESRSVFREELIALAEGKNSFESDVTIRDFRGNLRTLIMKLSVDPAHTGTLARVMISFLDITERRRVRNELVRLKRAVETSSEIIFTTDSEGVFTYVNPSFTRIYGYSIEEVIGLVTPRILKSGAMTAEEYEQMWHNLHNKKGVKREFINKTRDGRLLTIENAVSPVLDDAGNISGYFSVQADISERKRMEKKLVEGENRMQALLEAIPDAVFLKDGSGRWLMINAAAGKLFNVGVTDYVNKSDPELAELIPSRREQLLFCMTTDEQAWLNGALTRFEECITDDDGNLHYFETIKHPLFAPDGTRHRLVIVGRDITERREMEAKVLQAQNEWVETFDTINDAITIHDLNFNVIRANESAKKLLNTGEAVLQHQCFSAFHCVDSPIAGCPALQALQSGVATVAELFEPKLGKYLEVRAIPRRNADGEIDAVIHVVRDISERRILEEQIIQQQKLEGIGLLAGGIAHDFNNLLTPIYGYTEMILMDSHASEKVHSRATIIRESVEKAKILISQLLSFSSKQRITPHAYDLNEIISSFMTILKRTIRESIDIQDVMCSDTCHVIVDRTQIEQVLLNLAVNAQDAIDGNGKITIETGHVMLDDEYTLHHPGSRPGLYIMLTVTDNGCGMNDATLTHIFEPFYTTKAVGHGTGLGLSTVYGIVKQHEGYIDVQSRPDHGTTFRIYLPEQSSDSATETALAKQKSTCSQAIGTILLVEDNQTVLEVVREILTNQGHTVLCAALPEEALVMAIKNSASIDLLITDVVMPEMSGTELYERMEQLIPQLKVLFMSGYTNQMNVYHGTLEEGANFIAKPFTTEKFIERVTELL